MIKKISIQILSLVVLTGFLMSAEATFSTVQAQHEAPEWSKQAVWYQIFPERFRNGDTTNDPTAESIGAPDNWEITSWTGDWYQRSHWEQRVGPRFQDFVRMRRYGGDLQGVIDKLDYLKEIGVNAIYFNPVFEARSHHKYDARSYRHIDRFFGPNPEKDAEIIASEDPDDPSTWKWTTADSLFLKLLKKAHQKDMHVIIDGVFNHTGREFWAFQDILERQKESPYKDWYDIKSFDDPATADTNEFDYSGWWGYKGLPEFREKDGNLVKPVREHIFRITRRWMDPDGDGDPSDGVDGWRLDVVQDVGMPFWEAWHEHVRSINPEAYTTAEVWSDEAGRYVGEGPFTSVMNYRFAKALQQFLIDREISAAEFDRKLKEIRESFPDSANHVLQNLIDSHDTPRLASMVVNPGREYDRNGQPSDGFNVRRPEYEERELKKMVALFQFMYIGTPMIYYGTEAGMFGADDPHNRKPMVWSDKQYREEINHPLSKKRPRDDNNFKWNMFIWYKNIGLIHQKNEVFHTGRYKTLVADQNRDVFMFARYMKNGDVGLVIVNPTEHAQKIRIHKTDIAVEEWQPQLYNPLTNGVKKIQSQETIIFEIRPRSEQVWI